MLNCFDLVFFVSYVLYIGFLFSILIFSKERHDEIKAFLYAFMICSAMSFFIVSPMFFSPYFKFCP